MNDPLIFHWHRHSKHDLPISIAHANRMVKEAYEIEVNIGLIIATKSCQLINRYKEMTGYTLAVQGNKMGMAVCSEQDQFCRRTGRRIALERLKGCPIILE